MGKHQTWIQDYLASFENPFKATYGKCAEVSQMMQEAFPELERVRGYVYTPWGKREHWWLKTTDETIVDPTADQFPSIFEYEEWHEGMERRLGKCMDCGEEIWGVDAKSVHSTMFCNADCEEATRQYLGW